VVNLFSNFSLPQISVVARRTVLMGCGIGAVALVAGAFSGYPLFGVGLCLGLALAVNTLGRLGLISVIALGVTFVLAQLGFGILIGLAVFQFTLLGNVVLSMLRDPLMGDTSMGTALADDEDDA